MTSPNVALNISKAIEDNAHKEIDALDKQIESLEISLDSLYLERAKLQRIRRNNGFKPIPKQEAGATSRIGEVVHLSDSRKP